MSKHRMSKVVPLQAMDQVRARFIQEANIHHKQGEQPQERALPQYQEKIYDPKVQYTIQLQQSYILKLKSLAHNTGLSQQSILREIIVPGIDAMIAELENK